MQVSTLSELDVYEAMDDLCLKCAPKQIIGTLRLKRGNAKKSPTRLRGQPATQHCRVYVAGLHSDLKHADIVEMYDDFGTIKKVEYPVSVDAKIRHGTAVVTYQRAMEATRAERQMKGFCILGKRILTSTSKSRAQRQSTTSEQHGGTVGCVSEIGPSTEERNTSQNVTNEKQNVSDMEQNAASEEQDNGDETQNVSDMEQSASSEEQNQNASEKTAREEHLIERLATTRTVHLRLGSSYYERAKKCYQGKDKLTLRDAGEVYHLHEVYNHRSLHVLRQMFRIDLPAKFTGFACDACDAGKMARTNANRNHVDKVSCCFVEV